MNIEMQSLHDIIDYLQTIMCKIDKLENFKKDAVKFQHESEDLSILFGALAKAQSEMPELMLNKINPYFNTRYTDLRQMMRETRIPLTNHGLSVTQIIRLNNEGQSILYTRLGHESGQWVESTMRISPEKNDVKTIKSYTEFMKRLSYGSIVGVISEGDDDDGEIEMAQAREIIAKGPSTKYDARRESFEPITKEQLEELEYELSEYPDIGESVLDGLRILSLADMPKSQYMSSIRRIREIKQLRNGK